MFKLYIEIPGLPKLPNEISHSHWAVKAKQAKKWRQLVSILVSYKDSSRPKLEKAKIHYERHSAKTPDFDNLVSSFKHVQDGLIDAGIILNDSMANITCSYEWVKCSAGVGKITISVHGV